MQANESQTLVKKNKVVFAMVGSGWRSEAFLRIAKEMPELFEVCGLVTRSEEKGKLIEQKWGIKTFQSIDQLLKTEHPNFMVLSLPRLVAPDYIKQLAAIGMPVMTETPPAADVQTLIELNRLTAGGAKIQVAEQYHLQPLHAARIAFVKSGKLGEVTQTQLSVCHEYHAISLMRKFLGIGYENCKISARQFRSAIAVSPDRNGPPREEGFSESIQTIAQLDFDGKLGIYDFDNEQYFSWIRTLNVQVRGSKGQINDKNIRYLKDYKTAVVFDLERQNAGEDGNLEGYYLKGILAGEEWVYENPFIPAKLTDDGIAVASCLYKMNEYATGGSEFYSLADASQDQYLSLMIREAINTGETVVTQTQDWAH